LLSDLALSIAVGCDIKWLYNSSSRVHRPIGRSMDDAIWWRLTHHLSSGVGVPLTDAAKAADTLLGQGSSAGRLRLRATADDTVAVSVDIGRFRDGAALAIAAALHLATPRPRGRPRRQRPSGESVPRGDAASSASAAGDAPVRLERAFASIHSADQSVASVIAPVQLSAALAEAGVPFVFVGQLAGVFHGLTLRAESADLAVDFDIRFARAVAQVLTAVGAVPRGVTIRPEFTFDATLIRAVPCIALRIGGVAVNLVKNVRGVGEFAQIREQSEVVALESLTYRVLSRSGYETAGRTRLP
jgi:hypothetical protein